VTKHVVPAATAAGAAHFTWRTLSRDALACSCQRGTTRVWATGPPNASGYFWNVIGADAGAALTTIAAAARKAMVTAELRAVFGLTF